MKKHFKLLSVLLLILMMGCSNSKSNAGEYSNNGPSKTHTGVFKRYHDNGRIWYEDNYKNGKKNGKSKVYLEDGTLFFEENYKDGKKNGESKSYYTFGKIKIRVNYKDDKMHGEYIDYNEYGKISEKKYYIEGAELAENDYNNYLNSERLNTTEELMNSNSLYKKQINTAQKEVLHLKSEIEKNQNRIEEVSKENRQGISLATAMSQINPMGTKEGKVGLGTGIGYFKGETSVAVGIGYGVSENINISSKGAISVGDIKTFSIGAGVNIEF